MDLAGFGVALFLSFSSCEVLAWKYWAVVNSYLKCDGLAMSKHAQPAESQLVLCAEAGWVSLR